MLWYWNVFFDVILYWYGDWRVNNERDMCGIFTLNFSHTQWTLLTAGICWPECCCTLYRRVRCKEVCCLASNNRYQLSEDFVHLFKYVVLTVCYTMEWNSSLYSSFLFEFQRLQSRQSWQIVWFHLPYHPFWGLPLLFVIQMLFLLISLVHALQLIWRNFPAIHALNSIYFWNT